MRKNEKEWENYPTIVNEQITQLSLYNMRASLNANHMRNTDVVKASPTAKGEYK